MSFFYNYFNYYIYGDEPEVIPTPVTTTPSTEKKYLISIDDLKSVNLQPVKDVIPGPSRNMPATFDKVDLRNLNKAQMQAILNVKLKHTPPIEKPTYYAPRHPVLYELLMKFKPKEIF
jgi:hypothetical protein